VRGRRQFCHYLEPDSTLATKLRRSITSETTEKKEGLEEDAKGYV